ncbi:unnamed protein product [Rotaria sp. Silwood1]|nr:unnamed protein product [Rotaria sp. Silwood1]
MGSTFNKKQGSVQAPPQAGVPYPSYMPQPQYMPPPQTMQQPQFVPQPQYMPQPQMVPQQPVQYRPQTFPAQPQMFPPQSQMFPPQSQTNVRPPYPSGSTMPRPPGPSPYSSPNNVNPLALYENDMLLASLTGWTIDDIERLRQEFIGYSNPMGVIDREGFRKLYVASLLNMSWQNVELDSEMAFRNFDVNQTGSLDFNEYITACSRMSRELNSPVSPPPMSPPYIY